VTIDLKIRPILDEINEYSMISEPNKIYPEIENAAKIIMNVIPKTNKSNIA
jgi:hypothetical protein